MVMHTENMEELRNFAKRINQFDVGKSETNSQETGDTRP